MSFEQIRRERQTAAELLPLMSFFNPQTIPESSFRRHSKAATAVTKKLAEEEAGKAFDEDFSTLHAYSRVGMIAGSELCEMHALVQFCTRVWLSYFGDGER
jgi:hypothetical protein